MQTCEPDQRAAGLWAGALVIEGRAAERWERWERVPSQFEILADDLHTFVAK